MLPALREGQIVVGFHTRNFKVGDVVIAYQKKREVVKRISSIDKGRVFLVGDNEDQSTDSRDHGSVSDKDIEAVVRWPLALKK